MVEYMRKRGKKMAKLIIYGSQYGVTKKYAERLGEMTDTKVISYQQAKDQLTDASLDTIVYMGSLYAGAATGLKETAKLFPENCKIIIVTVGLMSPELLDTNLKKSVQRQVPKDVFERAERFHLQGAIDYSILSKKHKKMMGFLCNALKLKPKKTADDRALIDSYNKSLYLVDFDKLEAIKRYLM